MISQQAVIAIEWFHIGEICLTDTDDNDTCWQRWRLNDLLDGLGHISDDAISNQQQDLVLHQMLVFASVLVECCDYLPEVGRAWKTDRWQCSPIALQNALNPKNSWVHSVSINREAMRGSVGAHMSWDTSESESCKHLCLIIRLHDRANLSDCGLVLIILAHKVKRLWRWRSAIRSCVVNSQRQADLPAWPQIIYERWPLDLIKRLEVKVALTTVAIRCHHIPVTFIQKLLHGRINYSDYYPSG